MHIKQVQWFKKLLSISTKNYLLFSNFYNIYNIYIVKIWIYIYYILHDKLHIAILF